MPPTIGGAIGCSCGGFLLFAAAMVWLLGWKVVLIAVLIMIVLGFLAGIYVRNRLRNRLKEIMAMMGHPMPGGDGGRGDADPRHPDDDERHDLWVCPSCGSANPVDRKRCTSCGTPAR